jgi:hypothetical protein
VRPALLTFISATLLGLGTAHADPASQPAPIAAGTRVTSAGHAGLVRAGEWQPTADDLAGAEKLLAGQLHREYFRKYAGYRDHGRLLLSIRLECQELPENTDVMGGGDCYGNAEVDLKAKKVTSLRFNSER